MRPGQVAGFDPLEQSPKCLYGFLSAVLTPLCIEFDRLLEVQSLEMLCKSGNYRRWRPITNQLHVKINVPHLLQRSSRCRINQVVAITESAAAKLGKQDDNRLDYPDRSPPFVKAVNIGVLAPKPHSEIRIAKAGSLAGLLYRRFPVRTRLFLAVGWPSFMSQIAIWLCAFPALTAASRSWMFCETSR
jgi:hypothetical protein